MKINLHVKKLKISIKCPVSIPNLNSSKTWLDVKKTFKKLLKCLHT